MLEHILSRCIRCQNSCLLQKVFLEIISLQFFEVEISFQTMIEFLFLAKKLICELDYWVIKSKRLWVYITGQLVWYVHFSTMFNFQYKFLFQKLFFLEGRFYEKYIMQISENKHQFAFGELISKIFIIVFISYHHSFRAPFVHLLAI